MSFISRNNFATLEDIDLETNLIGVLLNNKYVTYSWIGGCWFRMDYDDLAGAYIDSSLSISAFVGSTLALHNSACRISASACRISTL